MQISRVHISNFKSIRELEIKDPNPFTVFVGPNGAGKSNIFEALEFAVYSYKISDFFQLVSMFKGIESISNYNSDFGWIKTGVYNEKGTIIAHGLNPKAILGMKEIAEEHESNSNLEDKFTRNFSRYFLNNTSLRKLNINDDSSLNLDGSNLEKVLKRILKNENKREDIIEWLQVLIPEFKDIQIDTSNLSGDVGFVIYEKHTRKPFPKHLISDGTKNILALLSIIYQSDESQFLCIEEPENGLHPYVIENLVSFFRNVCKEKGHVIWLNTHSQTLVRQLTAEEIIVVEKHHGATTVRQFRGEDMFGLKMDEAWLTNALGGGLP